MAAASDRSNAGWVILELFESVLPFRAKRRVTKTIGIMPAAQCGEAGNDETKAILSGSAPGFSFC
jgi:hypothetical protein